MYVEWPIKLSADICRHFKHHLLNGWKQVRTLTSDLDVHDSAIHSDLHLSKREPIELIAHIVHHKYRSSFRQVVEICSLKLPSAAAAHGYLERYIRLMRVSW